VLYSFEVANIEI